MSANHLNGFSTDGCSRAPDGYLVYNRNAILRCCVLHDVWYWLGGTAQQRLNSDQELYQCVLNASGSEWLAYAYYWAPRNFGGPERNTSYRWGYGWHKNRMYSAIGGNGEFIRNDLFKWVQELSNKELISLVE